VPLYLRDRDTTIHVLAAVTDGDVLRAGASDPGGFTVRFLEAVRREAADGRNLLLILDRLVTYLTGSPGVKGPSHPAMGKGGWSPPKADHEVIRLLTRIVAP
jgi:hypothetical protein